MTNLHSRALHMVYPKISKSHLYWRACNVKDCNGKGAKYDPYFMSERCLIRMNRIITRRIAIRTPIIMRIIIFSSLKIKFIFVISFFCLLSIEINSLKLVQILNLDLTSISLIGPKILNNLFIKTTVAYGP